MWRQPDQPVGSLISTSKSTGVRKRHTLKGQSVSAWVKLVLLTKAQEVLDAHRRTALSRKDWDAFLEIVDSDDEPSPALSRAAERYRKNRVDR
jgi:uncharacterized protein (DUF1778 family)